MSPLTVRTVVIRAGSSVISEITHVKKPGAIGAPGEIGLAIRAVEGVSGEMIRVLPQSASGEGDNKQTTSLVITLLCCVLGLLIKGGHAEIPAGTMINTHSPGNEAVAVGPSSNRYAPWRRALDVDALRLKVAIGIQGDTPPWDLNLQKHRLCGLLHGAKRRSIDVD